MVSSHRLSRGEKEMRLFPQSLAAVILTAGFISPFLQSNVLSQSPRPSPSTSGPDASDQKLSAVAAALEPVVTLQKTTANASPKRKHPLTRSVLWRKPTMSL